MKTLFDPAVHQDIAQRIGRLTAATPRVWGKMTPAQMFVHCALILEGAVGDRPGRQIFMGKLLGPFFRKSLLSDRPFGRNAPTGPDLVIRDDRDHEAEKKRLLAVLERFHRGGTAGAEGKIHGFLGRLSGDEWGRLQWKHLEHHLQQFGS